LEDRAEEPRHYLWLSAPQHPYPQDADLGVTSTYVELDSMKNSGYFEGIKAVVSDILLILRLKGERSLKGVNAGTLSVGLDLLPQDLEVLRRGLNRILSSR
jgi:hypothetical protein